MDHDEVEFPVLGEPFLIELANTRYRDSDEVLDYLADRSLVEAWFRSSPTACLRARPARWTSDAQLQLAAIRDAIHALINAVIDHQVPDRASVNLINAVARDHRVVTELRWSREGPMAVTRVEGGTGLQSFLGQIAVDTIELLTGADAVSLRRCESDDCWMLFLKDHPRRRWCHNSCGHRNRQASYYTRTRAMRGPKNSDSGVRP